MEFNLYCTIITIFCAQVEFWRLIFWNKVVVLSRNSDDENAHAHKLSSLEKIINGNAW